MVDDEHCYWGPKRVTCDICRGIGWLPPRGGIDNSIALGAWPDMCSICGGKGDLSLHLIAKAIDENPGVLYRLFDLRVRPKTARRLLDKLLTFIEGGTGLTPV